MTEQPPAPPAPPAGGGSPTRGATPGQAPGQATQPAEAPNVLAQSEQPAPGGNGLTRDEEADLARLQGKAARAAEAGGLTELKVEPPHASLYHASVTVGSDWTSVPSRLVPAIETAAATAGVTLTRKE